jgi:hypothetical protein
MSRFADTVKKETPRIVIMFARGPKGEENFQWGIVGQLPLLSVVGYIGHVQSDIRLPDPIHDCNQMALVIMWDATKKQFDYFIHPDIPVESMCGMLELVKMALVDSNKAQQVRNQQISILGPDGQPMRRR